MPDMENSSPGCWVNTVQSWEELEKMSRGVGKTRPARTAGRKRVCLVWRMLKTGRRSSWMLHRELCLWDSSCAAAGTTWLGLGATRGCRRRDVGRDCPQKGISAPAGGLQI